MPAAAGRGKLAIPACYQAGVVSPRLVTHARICLFGRRFSIFQTCLLRRQGIGFCRAFCIFLLPSLRPALACWSALLRFSKTLLSAGCNCYGGAFLRRVPCADLPKNGAETLPGWRGPGHPMLADGLARFQVSQAGACGRIFRQALDAGQIGSFTGLSTAGGSTAGVYAGRTPARATCRMAAGRSALAPKERAMGAQGAALGSTAGIMVFKS
jgi:hypothetical protein